MSDLISRQDAIDAINDLSDCPNGYSDTYDKACIIGLIEALPSAQPEIIFCKDCVHRDPEDKKCDCGHDILWQLPRQNDWYCADAERKSNEKEET